MRRNYLISITTITVACLLGTIVSAEYSLKGQAEIIGVWDVQAEAPKLDGPRRELDTEWEFKQDGTFIGKSKDFRAAQGELTSKLKYTVENGKIRKQLRPGSSKHEECVVIEKEGANMTIKCRNLYFFLTKQQ